MLKMKYNFSSSTSPPTRRQHFIQCKQTSSWAMTLLLRFMHGRGRIQTLSSEGLSWSFSNNDSIRSSAQVTATWLTFNITRCWPVLWSTLSASAKYASHPLNTTQRSISVVRWIYINHNFEASWTPVPSSSVQLSAACFLPFTTPMHYCACREKVTVLPLTSRDKYYQSDWTES